MTSYFRYTPLPLPSQFFFGGGVEFPFTSPPSLPYQTMEPEGWTTIPRTSRFSLIPQHAASERNTHPSTYMASPIHPPLHMYGIPNPPTHPPTTPWSMRDGQTPPASTVSLRTTYCSLWKNQAKTQYTTAITFIKFFFFVLFFF